MIAGRFLAGVGIGLSSALVPLYISEVRTQPHQPIGHLEHWCVHVFLFASQLAYLSAGMSGGQWAVTALGGPMS